MDFEDLDQVLDVGYVIRRNISVSEYSDISDLPLQQVIHHNSISPWIKENKAVTTLYRCEAAEAKALYIFDSAHKLQHNDQYDIGGAYTDSEAELWFFFTTTTCPGYSYLMNIFVCHRKPGIFTVGISESNTFTNTMYDGHKVKTLPSNLVWVQFNSTQPDVVHHVKTYRFSGTDLSSLAYSILAIPINIDQNAKCMLNKDLLQKIKSEHDFGENLFKDIPTDFVVTSSAGKEYKVHKIVIVAHSPVLRESVKIMDCDTLTLNMPDKEVDILLHFLYTGTIKDILDQKLDVLLEMADKFKLKNLMVLVKYAVKMSISSTNALSMAVLAQKYNCKNIQEIAFKYIKMHPEILETDAFTEIDNTDLVKKLLKYIHVRDK